MLLITRLTETTKVFNVSRPFNRRVCNRILKLKLIFLNVVVHTHINAYTQTYFFYIIICILVHVYYILLKVYIALYFKYYYIFLIHYVCVV